MKKYLDPKVDFLFKRIFGENKDILISFLNSMLPLEEGQEIVSIEYLSPEQVPDTGLGKNSIVDVRCIDNYDRAFIVEMQSEWSNVFRKRLLINGSKAVVRQLDKKFKEDKALKFQEIKPVYVLAVVNGNFSKGKDWYHHLKIMDSKNPDVVIEGLDYVLLELPNFTPDTWTLAQKKITVLWLRFLKEIDGYIEKLPKELTSNKHINNAIKFCEESALSPQERYNYERAKEAAQWLDSIKGLEDDAIEKTKLLVEKTKLLVEKDKTIAEKDRSIVEKDKTIEEKDKTISEKDKTIEEKDKEIEELKKLAGRFP